MSSCGRQTSVYLQTALYSSFKDNFVPLFQAANQKYANSNKELFDHIQGKCKYLEK